VGKKRLSSLIQREAAGFPKKREKGTFNATKEHGPGRRSGRGTGGKKSGVRSLEKQQLDQNELKTEIACKNNSKKRRKVVKEKKTQDRRFPSWTRKWNKLRDRQTVSSGRKGSITNATK